jgi:hypothetical protein
LVDYFNFNPVDILQAASIILLPGIGVLRTRGLVQLLGPKKFILPAVAIKADLFRRVKHNAIGE